MQDNTVKILQSTRVQTPFSPYIKCMLCTAWESLWGQSKYSLRHTLEKVSWVISIYLWLRHRKRLGHLSEWRSDAGRGLVGRDDQVAGGWLPLVISLAGQRPSSDRPPAQPSPTAASAAASATAGGTLAALAGPGFVPSPSSVYKAGAVWRWQ